MKIDQKKLTKYSIIFLLVVGVSLLFLVAKIIRDNSVCITDPIKFTAEKLADNGFNPICSCSAKNPGFTPFMFDTEGVYTTPQDIQGKVGEALGNNNTFKFKLEK